MKKYIIVILIFTNTFSFSQVSNPMQIKNMLKEGLAIHMLLLKNDLGELQAFLNEYNYLADFSEKMTIFHKVSENANDIHEFRPFIIVPSEKDEGVQNSLILTFRNGPQGIDYNTSLEISDLILSAISMNNCETGYECKEFSYSKAEDQYTILLESDKFKSVIQEDKYTIKTIGKHNEKIIYKASNFLEIGDNIMFFGPVDNAIFFAFASKIRKDGSYEVFLRINSTYSEYNNNTESFNYKEFMSFKNLNDKIWLDSRQ